MKLPKLSGILMVIGIFLLLVVIANATLTLLIPTTGTIATTANLTASPSTIDWGTLNPSQTVDRYVTLTNIGDTATQPLTVTATPVVGTLTENATSKIVPAHNSIIVDFRLTISASASSGAFSFTITISG
jgi:hypothetical protein